jgi:CBS domain-containing protein
VSATVQQSPRSLGGQPRPGWAHDGRLSDHQPCGEREIGRIPDERAKAMEATMHVNEAMSTDVKIASPDQTIREAAAIMAEIDAGSLPVGENDRLVGMITDRDIAVRGVAKGMKPDARVRDVMSREVRYCFEDEDIEDVALNMAEQKVRRLPVLNREKRLVGIISLGDIATADGPDSAGEAIVGISEPGGMHSQSGDGRG